MGLSSRQSLIKSTQLSIDEQMMLSLYSGLYSSMGPTRQSYIIILYVRPDLNFAFIALTNIIIAIIFVNYRYTNSRLQITFKLTVEAV